MSIQRLYDISPLRPLIERGYTILTPNYRLARRIKAVWDDAQATEDKRAWPTLPVYPLQSWLMSRWERAVGQGLLPALTPLSAHQNQIVWQQVIAEEARRGDRFDLLRPAAAAELAATARDDLLRWRLDLQDEQARQAFGFDLDCATFLGWNDAFEARLAERALCTDSDCIEQLTGSAVTGTAGRAVLVDFDDMPPLFLAAVENLCDEVGIIETTGEEAEGLAHAFSSRRAELAAVARWAAETNRELPQDTVGIVLTDMATERGPLEYHLRREFQCLGDDYQALPVNFSTGISLDQAPVVRDALAALLLGQAESTVSRVVTLLQSRFLRLPDAQSDLAQLLVTRLYDAGREFITPGQLRHFATEVTLGERKGLALGQRLLNLAGMRELRGRALPSEWVKRFTVVLDTWGWPGAGPLDSLEYQQVELWYRTLDDFGSLDGVCEPMDYMTALAQLDAACSGQMSQPQTADSQIQVLGPLEAAGLAFDHLWLCGMQGGDWPAPPRPNPFIPLQLQRQLQMPHATAEREWLYCAGLMKQYRRGARCLHASYCRQLDGIPDLPSSLLEGFCWQEPEEFPGVKEAWLARGRQQQLEAIQDDQAPPVTEDQAGASRGGSGLLEDQSQCPFRAFAKRRLAVKPLGDFSLALSAAERGSMLHDALYALWGEINDHRSLLALTEEDKAAVIHRAIHAAMEAMPSGLRHAYGAGYWQLEAQRLSVLLGHWLQVERKRGDFLVAQREQMVELQLLRLKIRLRVDRIDQFPDGSRMIIDYKSGRSSVSDWHGERPARPQLLLYGLAAPAETAALAFAQVRPRDCRFVGLGTVQQIPGLQSVDDWEEMNQQWRVTLERLAEAYLAGEAAVDPLSPGSCTWCGLQALCRVGDTETIL